MPRGWTALYLLSLLREYPPGWTGRAERAQPGAPREGTLAPIPAPAAAPCFGERGPCEPGPAPHLVGGAGSQRAQVLPRGEPQAPRSGTARLAGVASDMPTAL